MFFSKKETSNIIPKVVEVKLGRDYKFMYENFLISNQQELFLLLEASNEFVNVLKFNFKIYKYGYPNDEAIGAHPMSKYGLGFYGLFEVLNSSWANEICKANRVHPKHEDNLFSNMKHYVACFKDVTLDVLSMKMEEIQIPKKKVIELVNQQMEFLTINN